MFFYSSHNNTQKITTTSVINISDLKFFYIDINLYKNNENNLFTYHLIFIKENTIFKQIVDYKLYINDLNNNYELTKNIYKSLPVELI